jgi:hypothetical protein
MFMALKNNAKPQWKNHGGQKVTVAPNVVVIIHIFTGRKPSRFTNAVPAESK